MEDIMDNLQKFESEINKSLSGDKLKIATAFVAYMKENGMTAHAEHIGAFEYNGQWVCIACIIPVDGEPTMVIFDNPLTKHFDDFQLNDELKQFAWEHVNVCTSCGGSSGCGSQPGQTKTILGKELIHLCTSEVAFWNPNADALDKILQMINIWKSQM